MSSGETHYRPLVTTTDVTRWLKISRRTLCRLRSRGAFPAPLLVGTGLRWRPEDIEAWLASGAGQVFRERKEPRASGRNVEARAGE